MVSTRQYLTLFYSLHFFSAALLSFLYSVLLFFALLSYYSLLYSTLLLYSSLVVSTQLCSSLLFSSLQMSTLLLSSLWLQSAEQQESPSNFTKNCACHAKWISWLIRLTYETSFKMRGASKVNLEPHQILRLPRKMHLMIDPRLIWNVI